MDREPALLGVEPGAPDASAHEAETARVDARIDAALDDVESARAPQRRAASAEVRTPATADEPRERARTADRPRTSEPSRAAEPAVRAPSTPSTTDAPRARTSDGRPAARRDATTVYVVGFWRRLAAAAIDFAIIIPISALLTWICSKVAGVHLPPTRMHGPDFWVDLLIGSDPALMMALGLFLAIGALYLYLFQVTIGRTLGMKALRLRIIDVWGDPPSHARCAARTAAYFASAGTLLLGFVWIGFDSEKRGLHDWIAGTYVIRG
ncbi:MAG: RDD family protein [Deltaproteobacteria bacterium]|nr:RDD family protein [Deltaproteobacteria bacterium]